MPPRLRTLPERHGGRVVLGLLIAILALGLALRVQAALTPPEDVGNDAAAYMAIAKGLYTDGHYGGPTQSSPNDWSPGAPLLYAGVYFLTGGVHVKAALLVVALLGTGTILLTYLLGRRLAGPVAGVIGALLAATYPAFIDNNGRLLAEPVALFWLPAAMLAFLWASDGGRPWRWLAPGALLGLTTLTRPEYLPFVALFALLALLRVMWTHAPRRRGFMPGVAAAALLVVAFCTALAPWTARNAIVLDRFVPVTTGGGKALFVATYLPGDGRQQLVKRALIEKYDPAHPKDLPYTEVLQTEMEPLLDRVAKKYPELGRDAALARIGRENFVKYASEQPLDYAWMVIRKIQNMWDRGSSATMSPKFWFAYHKTLVFWALAALVALAWRRRWEALPIGLTILGITLIGGLLLAVPRRALPLMPFVLALAGVTIAWLGAAVPAWRRAILPRARWSSQHSESSASASRPA
jgi:4-amino-4-deoxy-L-arabinose transferase-like glycosyltransferase